MNNDNITFVKFYKNLISDYDNFISCDYVFQICVRNKYRIIRFREKMYIFLLFMNFFLSYIFTECQKLRNTCRKEWFWYVENRIKKLTPIFSQMTRPRSDCDSESWKSLLTQGNFSRFFQKKKKRLSAPIFRAVIPPSSRA